MQPSTGNSNELENWRSDLLKMFDDEEVDTKKINSTLIKCLPFVQESMQTRSLKEIQPDWPILFTLIGFKLHYQAVMKKSLDDLLEMIIKSGRNVMGYMKILQHKLTNLQSLIKSIQNETEEQKTQTELMGIAALVSTYFSENFSLVYTQVCKFCCSCILYGTCCNIGSSLTPIYRLSVLANVCLAVRNGTFY